jgi:N-acetylmuramoyl-L-alanine amidase
MEPGRSPAARRTVVLVTVVVALIAVGVVALVAVHLHTAGGTPSAAVTAHVSASSPAPATTPAAPPTQSSPAQPTPPPAPLAGKVVGIDPGHNGGNGADPAYLNQLIWNGREQETCDTTGTETDSGYTEARFNFNVAGYLRSDLQRAGARVVMTRTSNDGVGPCVNRRSQILNDAHADVAVDIHADGGPSWGRGFTVLEPVADGPNDKVLGSSDRFGADVHQAMISASPMRVSDYYGQDGYEPRDDLAGLNLTTVPKVLIECGNMRNAADAQLLTSKTVQEQIARALADAIIRFLTNS